MTQDLNDRVLVLCDHDALYAAIQLKLTSLSEVRVTRFESALPEQQGNQPALTDFDLIIVATLSAISDPDYAISKAPLPIRTLETPVLIISECPSRADSGDKITYLNFPFDLDELACTVSTILARHP